VAWLGLPVRSSTPKNSDRELVITPSSTRSLVFEAWTKPEHARSWYGLRSMSTTVFEAICARAPRSTPPLWISGSDHRLAAGILRLDDSALAAVVAADPDAALRRMPEPILIDEWQEIPEVLGAVKRAVDDDPRPGRSGCRRGTSPDHLRSPGSSARRCVPASVSSDLQRDPRANADTQLSGSDGRVVGIGYSRPDIRTAGADRLIVVGEIDWSRAILEAASVRVKFNP
jgi:hypothetical protein